MPTHDPARGAIRPQPAVALRRWSPAVRGLVALVVLVSGLSLRTWTRPGPQPTSALLPVLRVDPSTAPAHVLEALPQIGPTLADRIVAARQEGPFASLDDLRRRVRGLGPATVAKLARHLRFDDESGPAIAPDRSLAATSPDERNRARMRRLPVR